MSYSQNLDTGRIGIKFLHPRANADMVGYIPDFLDPLDPEPAKQQIIKRYRSGWHSFTEHRLDPKTLLLHYPGDPPTRPLAELFFEEEQGGLPRTERVIVYEHAWVAIIQADGTHEIARLD